MSAAPLTGAVLVAITVLEVVQEWIPGANVTLPAAFGVALVLALVFTKVRRSGRVFVLIGCGLLATAIATRPDWLTLASAAFRSAAFIAAFFTALAILRTVATTSPAIERCGRFLADQPPGRRYLALTIGGHAFGVMLNYGAITLLGSLAESSARREPDVEIRTIRLRRMLLAVQRGLVSMLPWSPLAFASAIVTSLVPGGRWVDSALPALVSSLILAGVGWAIDTAFKPRLTRQSVPRALATPGGWTSVAPLFLLLAILLVAVGGLHVATGVRAVGVVILIVPMIALAWIVLQAPARSAGAELSSRLSSYVTRELPAYRSELVLLMMAGFIGALGARMMSPLVVAAGVDLSAVPAAVLLAGLVWIIPLAGLIGMNPILSVSLIAPLLPDANAIGISPAAMVTALTSGWALCGAISPYTATTLMVGNVAGVNAWTVGLKWNATYTIACAFALSAWVVVFARLG